MRRTFVQVMEKLMEKNKNVFLLTIDVGFGVLESLKNKYPNRYINTGIGEANAVGVATGLALKGKIPFVYSINSFLVFRATEQIKMLSHMNQHVVLVGVGIEDEYTNQGISHYSFGDLQILRAIPNLTVLTPKTKEDVKDCIKQAIESEGTHYLRLSRF